MKERSVLGQYASAEVKVTLQFCACMAVAVGLFWLGAYLIRVAAKKPVYIDLLIIGGGFALLLGIALFIYASFWLRKKQLWLQEKQREFFDDVPRFWG